MCVRVSLRKPPSKFANQPVQASEPADPLSLCASAISGHSKRWLSVSNPAAVCYVCLMRSLRLLQKLNYVILSGCFRCDFAEFARTVVAIVRLVIDHPTGQLAEFEVRSHKASTQSFVSFLSNRQQTKRIRIINFFYLSLFSLFLSLFRSVLCFSISLIQENKV